jgi:hypothetical protein
MSVRGYADWNPKPDAAHWVRCTRQVLEEYRDEWPLTVRQLFYRLVAVHGYTKTEAAYTKLTQILGRARRAGMIKWGAIRDGGAGYGVDASYFDGAEDFEQSVRDTARHLKLDRQKGQDKVIELWCEAGGMVPILQRVGNVYSARVNTGGGYDSVTAKHRLAQRVRDRAKDRLRTLVLHVGDFDGSGEDMCEVLREDAGAMVFSLVFRTARREMPAEWIPMSFVDDVQSRTPEGDDRLFRWASSFFDVERVALTGEQVVDRNVITAPPKPSDSRTRRFVERNHAVVAALGTEEISAQLEALTPSELRGLLSGVIEEHLDMDQYRAVRDEEEDVRAHLLKRLDGNA